MSGMKNEDQKWKTIWEPERYFLKLSRLLLSVTPEGGNRCAAHPHVDSWCLRVHSREPRAYLISARGSQWSYRRRVRSCGWILQNTALEMLFKEPFIELACATQSASEMQIRQSARRTRARRCRTLLWVHGVFRLVSGMAERSASAAPAHLVWVCKKDINHSTGSVRGWLCVHGTHSCVFVV